MMGLSRNSFLALLIVLAGMATPLLGAVQSSETRTFDYHPNDTLIIQNDYGRVQVRTWDQPRLQIRIRRFANRKSDLEEVVVTAKKVQSKILLNAYFYKYDSQSVYLEVQAPADLNLVVWGINPAVEVSGLSGFVHVYTLTGLITASDLTSSVALTTETGSVLFSARRQPNRDIRLASIQGSVRCQLNPALNLRSWLRAGARLSWNNEIEMTQGQLERQLGVGGPLLHAGSMEGNVSIELNLESQAPDLASVKPAAASRKQMAASADDARPWPNPVADRPLNQPSPRRLPQDSQSLSAKSGDKRSTDSAKTQTSSVPSPDQPAPIQDVDYSGDATEIGYSLKVDVNWTYLNVSVRDYYTNRSVPNLVQDDFIVFEDGIEQRIEKFESHETPFNLLLLLDVSGSTRSHINLIKTASIEFTREIKPNDKIGLATFNSRPRLIQDFTNDRLQVAQSIERVRSGGNTAFYDALDTSIHDYMAGVKGRKAIVVFTDGVDGQLTGDSGSKNTFSDLFRSIQEIDTIIYTIFLDTEKGKRRSNRRRNTIDILADIIRGGGVPVLDPHEAYTVARNQLERIADQTGGRTYLPRDIYDLDRAYSEIADDLRIQYWLAYSSSLTENDKRWREVQVKVLGRDDLAVRTRKGYYAGSRS